MPDRVIEEVLEHLVTAIVDNPDDVDVRSRPWRRGGRDASRGSNLFEVRVNPDDLGRVIGRGGRTASALRTVVDALAGHKIRVDFVDVAQGR
jgi:predicted RNA-binding protein YlqC (UPF0109 family)